MSWLRFATTLLVLAATSGLIGCVAALPLAAGSAATLIATKKTPVDHAVSWMSGKDCSVLRRGRGEPYCADADASDGAVGGTADAAGTAAGTEALCYRTLGDVTCYRQPEPQETKRLPVGTPPS